MVEDAVEAIGFGTFQWKLSILTGLAWVRTVLEFKNIPLQGTVNYDCYLFTFLVFFC